MSREKIEAFFVQIQCTQMESKLAELMSRLATYKQVTSKIADERREFETMIEEKEVDNNYNIHCVTLEIRKLQNEIGSAIVLTTANEKLLRKHLTVIDSMIHRTENDKSTIELLFEVPNGDDTPYSIHVDIDNYYLDRKIDLVDDPKLRVVIKTKCSAVERIVRETIVQEYNYEHYRPEKLSEEEQKDFEMNICRKWRQSYHGESSIKFIHKKDSPDEICE